jgi:hypothetical protein
MSRAVFLGDSHTCGYITEPGKLGPSSYSLWNDNNYAEFYAKENNKNVSVYAIPGAANKIYPDWLRTMLDKHPDTDEVFVLLASWNRFILAFNETLSPEVIPSDYFTEFYKNKHGLVDIYQDCIFKEDRFQLLNKPTFEDFGKVADINFNYQNGLVTPDLRKDCYMDIKLFFELNTHLEQREFFKDISVMDSMCQEHGCKLYLFNMTDRVKFPTKLDFYSKLKSTKISSVTVESYFKKKFIDHSKFFLPDNEHYNEEYHQMIASNFIPWLKQS